MASTFNLCALIVDWRVILNTSSTSSEAVGTFVPDPKWYVSYNPRWLFYTESQIRLTAVNAVSFAIAILANITLLAKNFGRISFDIASFITIIGWHISSFLLIGLVAAAPAHLPLAAGEARRLSQGYYYAILAAAVYFLVSSLLVCTAYGVYMGKYASDIKLTFSQSTLIFQVILFFGTSWLQQLCMPRLRPGTNWMESTTSRSLSSLLALVIFLPKHTLEEASSFQWQLEVFYSLVL